MNSIFHFINKRCRQLIAIFLVSIIVASCQSGVRASEAYYAVTIDAEKSRVAKVVATIVPDNGKIYLNDHASDTGLFNGWATFIHLIEARTIDGIPLELEYLGKGIWQTHQAKSSPIEVSYQMLLQHDRFPNNPGDDELAYAQPWGVMWTGRALFVVGEPSDVVKVEFNLNEAWVVTSPWNASKHKANAFEVEGTNSLLNSAFMAGTHYHYVMSKGESVVRLGLGGDSTISLSKVFVSIIERYTNAYSILFDSTPEQNMVLLAAEGRHNGGGVIGSSISMVSNGKIGAESIPLIQYITTHEMYHLWNAQFNYLSESDMYWFIEGFAEYETYLTAAQVGDIGPDFLISQISERYQKYLNALANVSMVEAGNRKLDNYDLIYSGGMIAALVLDLTIRKKTNQNYSLASIHRALYKQFQNFPESTLSNESLITTINQITGIDFRRLFKRSILGSEPLQLSSVLQTVGLSLRPLKDKKLSDVVKVITPNAEQTKAFNKWLEPL